MLIGGGGGTSFDDVAALGAGDGSDATTPSCVSRWPRPTSATSSCAFSGSVSRRPLSQGRAPGAEASLLKLAMSRQSARLGDLGLALLGPAGLATWNGKAGSDQAAMTGFWQDRFLGQWSMRIGGGTDEIQRNQIGERVLGLPREPARSNTISIVTSTAPDVVWNPLDPSYKADPHPIWRRLRDEAPLYRNEQYDFWALSRFADVMTASMDPRTFSSAHGTVLEMMSERPSAVAR